MSLSLFAQGVLPFQLTDDFANRPVISGPEYWIVGSLSNATIEAGEPFIDGVSSGQTAWGMGLLDGSIQRNCRTFR
jgi:hypothetical protein